MKKFTKEAAYVLNKNFGVSGFKTEMSDMDFHTVIAGINSRSIMPGRNNLKIISDIKNKNNIQKILGTFEKGTNPERELLRIEVLGNNGEVIWTGSLRTAGLYRGMKKGISKQWNDINKEGKVEFNRVPGSEAFITNSKYLGFLVL